jgi:CDP-paratose 2-epimerase
MSVALITGAAGLVGSESVRFFSDKGFDVVGIDNDMRRQFFGDAASTAWRLNQLKASVAHFRHIDADIRDATALEELFETYRDQIGIIIHTAAQPSHDWAAEDPITDFSVNATGTLQLLNLTRTYCADATFIFTSTNKVYGDSPNYLPLKEQTTRYEVDDHHPYALHGIDEKMGIDQSKHSLFGASKVAADVMVQEYGRYFGMRTGVFRCGCITGAGHSAAEKHGFLSYLVQCAVNETPYTVFGYKGKQVRDNIHSHDLVNMFWHFYQHPRPGAVYNAGGSRHSNCSVKEAIALCEEISAKPMNISFSEKNRNGDHIWWVSDIRKFRNDYPNWWFEYDLRRIIQEMVDTFQK